uniref:Uncharacterized protein n=1 Tax=Ditylenchus dipsaci TaxID=166011 RepID=A0A915D624_9BILA
MQSELLDLTAIESEVSTEEELDSLCSTSDTLGACFDANCGFTYDAKGQIDDKTVLSVRMAYSPIELGCKTPDDLLKFYISITKSKSKLEKKCKEDDAKTYLIAEVEGDEIDKRCKRILKQVKCQEGILRPEYGNPVANLLLMRVQYQMESFLVLKGLMKEGELLEEGVSRNCFLLADYVDTQVQANSSGAFSLSIAVLIFLVMFAL